MLLFWKWNELYCGNSSAQFSEIRTALNNNNIKYSYKIARHDDMPPFRSSARNVLGSIGEISSVATMYYIYVYKSDFEKATHIIRNK